MTHVTVHGSNVRPPPRPRQAIILPLKQLWEEKLPQDTRQKVLRILSLAAANRIAPRNTKLTAPLDNKEASDE